MAQPAVPSIVEGLTAGQREAVEKLYRGVAGEFDLLDEAVTPNWSDIPAAPGQAPGPDGVKPQFAKFHRVFQDVSVTIHEVVGANGRAAVRAEIRASFTGEWMGVVGTGRECVIPIHEFHHFDGDRIA
ncbi:ester cyclase, partial [Saccharothrix coeruleofusca]|uniref:ester cyclase n=1 Tax=Saccharothrix coeruleofusca TaxID=33919 RepID=UPI00166FB4C9